MRSCVKRKWVKSIWNKLFGPFAWGIFPANRTPWLKNQAKTRLSGGRALSGAGVASTVEGSSHAVEARFVVKITNLYASVCWQTTMEGLGSW